MTWKSVIAFTSSQRLELRPQHPALDGERDDEQQVVARDAEQAGARHEEHGDEEQPGEQAGARLLEAEVEELDDRVAQVHGGES